MFLTLYPIGLWLKPQPTIPPPRLSRAVADAPVRRLFLFIFAAVCLSEALFLSRFSLIHRPSHKQIDRRVCVRARVCAEKKGVRVCATVSDVNVVEVGKKAGPGVSVTRADQRDLVRG